MKCKDQFLILLVTLSIFYGVVISGAANKTTATEKKRNLSNDSREKQLLLENLLRKSCYHKRGVALNLTSLHNRRISLLLDI